MWAQVYHAISHEWAQTADDIVHRRTTLGLRGLDSPRVRARISSAIKSTSPTLSTELSTAKALWAPKVPRLG